MTTQANQNIKSKDSALKSNNAMGEKKRKTYKFKAENEDQVLELASKIMESRFSTYDIEFNKSTKVTKYLKNKLAHQERECFLVMFLTAQNTLIKSEVMFEGTVDSAAVYPREVVKRALELNCVNVVLGHNFSGLNHSY